MLPGLSSRIVMIPAIEPEHCRPMFLSPEGVVLRIDVIRCYFLFFVLNVPLNFLYNFHPRIAPSIIPAELERNDIALPVGDVRLDGLS